jgi:tungstate transport system permease protein
MKEMSNIFDIIILTLFVTILSTSISTILGIPLGYILSKSDKKYKIILQSITTALTGLPPVVAGLCIYFLLTRNGPLGNFRLLYSPSAMVIAQILIVLPIIAAFSYPIFLKTKEEMFETCVGLRLSSKKTFLLLLKECRFVLVSAVMMGFGRAISEVGAVMMVGGNIDGKTRVITTAILTQTNQGNYNQAIILGGVLLLIAITVNLLAQKYKESNR